MKKICIILFLSLLPLIRPLEAGVTVGGTYEMELKGNLQKDRQTDIWENDVKKTVPVPYGMLNQDHRLMLDFGLSHPDLLYRGSFGLEVDVYNPEGRDYYVDITDIRKKKAGVFISHVDLTLFTEYFQAYLYKWRGHRESTDLLKLYKCDWDLHSSRYLGIYSPVGIEVSGGGGTFLEGLFVAAGQTPSLANQSSVYAEYMRSFQYLESTLIYYERTSPYLDLSDPENILVYDIKKGYAEGVFTYPQFPQTEYIYSERVMAWDNKIRLYHHSLQFELAKYDATKHAFYYGMRLDTSPLPYRLGFILTAEKADRYAGNRKEYSLEGKVSPARSFTFSAKVDDRRPVYGPLFNNLLSAPLVGEHNREARIYSVSATYDPTRPTSLTHWNANFMEDALLAVRGEYRYTDYPGYTDNPVYFNWDDSRYIIYGGDRGLYPCKLHSFSAKLISNIFRPVKAIFYFNTGIKQARWPSSMAMVPWTKNYSSYLELRKEEDFLAGVMYLMDDWEIPEFGSYDERWPYKTNPYDYNRDIGIPWDHYLAFRLVKFFKAVSFELLYQYIVVDGRFDDTYEDLMDAYQRRDMLKERMNEVSVIFRLKF